MFCLSKNDALRAPRKEITIETQVAEDKYNIFEVI